MAELQGKKLRWVQGVSEVLCLPPRWSSCWLFMLWLLIDPYMCVCEREGEGEGDYMFDTVCVLLYVC